VGGYEEGRQSAGRRAPGGLLVVLFAVSAFGADKWIDYRIGPFHVISNAGDKAAREKLNQRLPRPVVGQEIS